MPVLRSEAATLAAFATLIIFLILGDSVAPENVGSTAAFFLLAILFVIMLWAAFSVVRHAECLATLLGGTLWNIDPHTVGHWN